MVLRPRSYLKDVSPYVPGTSYACDLKKMVRLSSNEGALGMSQKALLAYHQAIMTLSRYPDRENLHLREALAKRYQIDMHNIVCGNGSDELIQLLMWVYTQEGDDILYSEHGFLLYPINACLVGARPIAVPEQALKADIQAILDYVTPRTRMVILANPNNPTGSYLNEAELYLLRGQLREDILLVIDAAYSEFVERKDYSHGMSMVGQTQNVAVLRTFSKIYGLAGLRLGWLYAASEVISMLDRVRQPFNINSVAQLVGVAALGDTQHVKQAYEHNKTYRTWLERELTHLGWKVYPSVANFLLVSFGSTDQARAVDHTLRDQGILVRPMDAYRLSDCLRITIGKPEELHTLVAALKAYKEWGRT